MFAGYLRGRRNVRDMRTTLERIKKVVEEELEVHATATAAPTDSD